MVNLRKGRKTKRSDRICQGSICWRLQLPALVYIIIEDWVELGRHDDRLRTRKEPREENVEVETARQQIT